MKQNIPCQLCNKPLLFSGPSHTGLGNFYNCSQCGKYTLDDNLIRNKLFEEKKHLLAGYLYNTSNRVHTENSNVFTVESFKQLLTNSLIPKKISEKPLKFLKHLNYKTTEYGEAHSIIPASMYAKSYKEAQNIIETLTNAGYVKNKTKNLGEAPKISLTYKGMKYIEDFERRKLGDEKKAFVAMWFNYKDPIVNNLWGKIIKPACEELGYEPLKIDDREYNDNVVDEIIALIKETDFTIADFSGYRGGVYYEAGFARGYGKEVINLCHTDWFDGDSSEGKRVHFDVSHINFIVWETGKEEEAKEKLKNRIRALPDIINR